MRNAAGRMLFALNSPVTVDSVRPDNGGEWAAYGPDLGGKIFCGIIISLFWFVAGPA